MLCTPVASAAVAHAAVRVLPAPASAMDEHPAIGVPASLKVTEPVGDVPTTVAPNRTLWPCVAGFAELLSVVVVAVGPPPGVVTFTSIALEEALTT